VLAQQADCTTGAGQLDLAVYRPSNGVWQVCERGSSAGNAVTRDYNGDGRTELAVWRPLGDYTGDDHAELAVCRQSDDWFIYGFNRPDRFEPWHWPGIPGDLLPLAPPRPLRNL
jgi:hypothetical protein